MTGRVCAAVDDVVDLGAAPGNCSAALHERGLYLVVGVLARIIVTCAVQCVLGCRRRPAPTL
jgi:hypothetical protein